MARAFMRVFIAGENLSKHNKKQSNVTRNLRNGYVQIKRIYVEVQDNPF